MKYSYNDIMEPWYPEEFKIITMPPVKQNMYAVSNYGNIINIHTGRQLAKIRNEGYVEVHLQTENKVPRTFPIHRLVAYEFIPRTQEDIDNNRDLVNHRNFIKNQNYVHNLEWVNHSENTRHGNEYSHLKLDNTIVQRIPTTYWGITNRGESHGMAKLSEEEVHTICQMRENGYTYNDIYKAIGLERTKNNHQLLMRIFNGSTWSHVSSQYNIHKQPFTDLSEYVIPTCELLQEGKRCSEIAKILNVDIGFVSRIKNRKTYTKISKDYNF